MWLSGFKWMFLIMGTMIGAGYASGRELWQFFGYESGLAIILFAILFSTSCYIILKISHEKKSEHYLPVLEALIGKKMSYVYDIMIILYLFSTTVIMIAGGGATIEMFNVPYWLGVVLFAVMLVILFIWDIKGMLSMNSFILPLLIGGLLFLLISFTFSSGLPWDVDMKHQSNWPSAFTFTALNILPLVAVLSAIGKEIKRIGEAWIASIGSGLILGTISFLYNQSLIQVAEEVMLYEIPLFAILDQYPYMMLIIMSILLWMAIYTTAASGIFGIVSRIRDRYPYKMWILALFIIIIMIPLTTFGFSTLIEFLYPLYGMLNLYVLISILLYPIIERKS